MLKNSFKQFLKFILVMVFSSLLATSASSATIDETGAIIDNNTFATAHTMGYWQYHGSTICRLKADQTVAYFSFTANANDRVYASVTLDQAYVGTNASIQIFNANQSPSSTISTTVINPTSLMPFIFAPANSTLNSQTFFIKVTRGSYVGDMIFPVRIENRIGTGVGTFNFTGTATNAGNPSILTNPNGVDSSVISMNLTTNSTIPTGAIVKSISTASTITPSMSGVTHKILSTQTNVWYTSSVSSATSGTFAITTANNLEVARTWSFKYNVKPKGASTMKNVKATINYEFDKTNQF